MRLRRPSTDRELRRSGANVGTVAQLLRHARELLDIIEDEIARHWPRTPNADATKRIDLMRDWAKKNPRKPAGSGN